MIQIKTVGSYQSTDLLIRLQNFTIVLLQVNCKSLN